MLLVGPRLVQGSPFPRQEKAGPWQGKCMKSVPSSAWGSPLPVSAARPAPACPGCHGSSFPPDFFFFFLTFRTAFLPSNTDSQL